MNMETTLLPNIAINTIADNDILNSYMCLTALYISGITTQISAGTTVSLTLNDLSYYSTTIGNGSWSIRIQASDLILIPSGQTIVTASVQYLNSTITDSRVLYVHHSIPALTINSITSDDIINLVEGSQAVEISGTTSFVENGQIITVAFENKLRC